MAERKLTFLSRKLQCLSDDSIWNAASLWQGAVLNMPNVLDFVHCHIILYISHTHTHTHTYIYYILYI